MKRRTLGTTSIPTGRPYLYRTTRSTQIRERVAPALSPRPAVTTVAQLVDGQRGRVDYALARSRSRSSARTFGLILSATVARLSHRIVAAALGVAASSSTSS